MVNFCAKLRNILQRDFEMTDFNMIRDILHHRAPTHASKNNEATNSEMSDGL